MADKTGGPAFPHMMRHVDENIVEQLTHGGMTLRDWFAGQAIGHFSPKFTPNSIAKCAYEMADAMLAEREKRG